MGSKLTNNETHNHNIQFLVERAGMKTVYASKAASVFNELGLGAIKNIIKEHQVGPVRLIVFTFERGRYSLSLSERGSIGNVTSLDEGAKIVYCEYE